MKAVKDLCSAHYNPGSPTLESTVARCRHLLYPPILTSELGYPIKTLFALIPEELKIFFHWYQVQDLQSSWISMIDRSHTLAQLVGQALTNLLLGRDRFWALQECSRLFSLGRHTPRGCCMGIGRKTAAPQRHK